MAQQEDAEKLKEQLAVIEQQIEEKRTRRNKLQQHLRDWSEDTGYSTIPDDTGIAIAVDANDMYPYKEEINIPKQIQKIIKELNELYQERDKIKRKLGINIDDIEHLVIH